MESDPSAEGAKSVSARPVALVLRRVEGVEDGALAAAVRHVNGVVWSGRTTETERNIFSCLTHGITKVVVEKAVIKSNKQEGSEEVGKDAVRQWHILRLVAHAGCLCVAPLSLACVLMVCLCPSSLWLDDSHS